jgi:hypothetical protein
LQIQILFFIFKLPIYDQFRESSRFTLCNIFLQKKIMKINRAWAMPNKWTFQIPPIKKLIHQIGGDFKGWIDPFAGENSPAEITNDLNTDRPTAHHLYAHEFAAILKGKYKGVLFDPPYSLRQIKECYSDIGAVAPTNWTLDAGFTSVKDLIAPKIENGGYAICFGWNSNGFGRWRGFEIIELLIVPHGGHHYDTIVTVERKIPTLF